VKHIEIRREGIPTHQGLFTHVAGF